MAVWGLWNEWTSRSVRRIAVDVDVCDLLLQARETNTPTPTIRIVAVHGCLGGTRSDVAVCLLRVGVGGRVTVGLLLFVLPVFEFACVLDILFEVRDRPAVRAQEVWPRRSIQDGTDALVMPHM
jgi:hypothetical protein